MGRRLAMANIAWHSVGKQMGAIVIVVGGDINMIVYLVIVCFPLTAV